MIIAIWEALARQFGLLVILIWGRGGSEVNQLEHKASYLPDTIHKHSLWMKQQDAD